MMLILILKLILIAHKFRWTDSDTTRIVNHESSKSTKILRAVGANVSIHDGMDGAAVVVLTF